MIIISSSSSSSNIKAVNCWASTSFLHKPISNSKFSVWQQILKQH